MKAEAEKKAREKARAKAEMEKKQREAFLAEVSLIIKISNYNCFLKRNALIRRMGVLGGAGHFYQNDKGAGGVRYQMGENELRQVLKLMSMGGVNFNLKFWKGHDWKIAEAGWEMEFNGAHGFGGDFGYSLWIGNNLLPIKVKLQNLR